MDILGIRIQKVEGASFIAAERLRNSRDTAERVRNATAVQWIDKTICIGQADPTFANCGIATPA